MKRNYFGVLLFVVLFSPSLCAQSNNPPPVSIAFAALVKSVDAKTSAVGDELTLRTLKDLFVDGQLIIPKDSRLVGRVAGANTKGKDEPKSVLSLVIDKAVLANGVEIPVQGIIVAVAAPEKSLSSDPTYAMMHSNEPKMIGSGARGTASTGSLPPSSKASSNAAVATAEMKGHLDEPLMLTEDSQGAFGYDGLTISWHLAMPPPLSVFTSKAKNVRLEANTQLLIRMAQPRLPQ